MADETHKKWLLAIDTSSDWTGVALTDGTALFDHNWDAGRRQTTTVMVEIDRRLTSQSLRISDLGAIAVAIGPGSFSGLRVGMSIAKGLALAMDIPIIGIPTLEATARLDTSGASGIALIKAGRARYVWTQVEKPETYFSGKIDAVIEAARVIGSGSVVGEVELQDEAVLASAGLGLFGSDIEFRRAAEVARMGWERWESGQISDLASLEPVYVHGTGTPT